MYDYKEILAYEFGANTVESYLVAFGFFILLFVGFQLFKLIIVKRLKHMAKKTDTDFDDVVVQAIEDISIVFYLVISLYIPLKFLAKNPEIDFVIEAVFVVIVVYRAISFLQTILEYLLRNFLGRKEGKNIQSKTTFAGLRLVIKMILWSSGLLLILSNLGFNITSLVASMGIGGIAIALAVQSILGDIFSSFTIYFDKPFDIGDYIVVGEHDGEVEKIGLKTTRIRTMQGEELIISNQELTSSRIQNFKKMKNRRVSFALGLTYDTSSVKLKEALEIVKKAIKKEKMAEFVRVHFTEFGDFSLKIEAVYYVLSRDYSDYLKIQEKVNFGVKSAFEKAKIDMAFPTQTVIVEK